MFPIRNVRHTHTKNAMQMVHVQHLEGNVKYTQMLTPKNKRKLSYTCWRTLKLHSRWEGERKGIKHHKSLQSINFTSLLPHGSDDITELYDVPNYCTVGHIVTILCLIFAMPYQSARDPEIHGTYMENTTHRGRGRLREREREIEEHIKKSEPGYIMCKWLNICYE